MRLPAGAQHEAILALLERHPGLSGNQIAARLDIATGPVAAALHRLRLRHKRIHIDAYRRGTSGRLEAVYVAGAGVDAKKPRRRTNAENIRAYKARQRPKVASVFDLARLDVVKFTPPVVG